MKELALTINGTPIPAPAGIPTGGLESFNIFSQGLFTILIIVSVILALFFLIFGGIKWITSGGEKEGVDGARKMITFAIVGIIVVLLTATIINLVGNFFGLHLVGEGGFKRSQDRLLREEMEDTRSGNLPGSGQPTRPKDTCPFWEQC